MQKVSVIRFAVSGAITLIALFALCWLGAVIFPTSFTHAFVTLFTAAPMRSSLAFGEGICSALLFGFAAGGILACSYNVSAWSQR